MNGTESSRLPAAIAAVAGGVVASALVHGIGPTMAIRIVLGGLAGGLVGLLPYFVGRGRAPWLASLATWCCVGAGMVLGLMLAFPVAVVFSIVLATRAPATASGGP